MRIGNLEIETRSPTYIGFILNGEEGSADVARGKVSNVRMDLTSDVPRDILEEVRRRLQTVVTHSRYTNEEDD